MWLEFACPANQHPKRTIEKKGPQAFAHLENFSQNVSAMFYNHTILFVLFSLFWIVFGLDYNRHSLSRWNRISQNNIDVLTLWRHADSRWRRPSMNFIFSFLRTVTELTTKNDMKVLDYEWLSVWKQHQWNDGVPLLSIGLCNQSECVDTRCYSTLLLTDGLINGRSPWVADSHSHQCRGDGGEWQWPPATGSGSGQGW